MYRAVAFAVAAGAASALAATFLHQWLLTSTELSLTTFSRYVAPVTEESLKAAYVVLLLHRRRFGFLVDAAVIGFAVGAGFALVENIYYLERSFFLDGAELGDRVTSFGDDEAHVLVDFLEDLRKVSLGFDDPDSARLHN